MRSLRDRFLNRGDRGKVYPVPEATDGERWTVTDSGGASAHCSPGSKTMHTHLSPEPCSRCRRDHARTLRVHETAHAAISPPDASAPDTVGPDCLLAVEDMRLNRFVRSLPGMGELPPALCPDMAARASTSLEELRAATLQLVAAIGGPDEDAVREGIEDGPHYRTAPALADTASRMMNDGIPGTRRGTSGGIVPDASWSDTVRIAEWLEGMLAELTDEDGNLKQPGGIDAGDGMGPEWGDMEIVPPSLTERVKTPPAARRYRVTDEGTRFRSPHRFPIDRRVFGASRRIPGGTILVDCSGSMEWSEDDLESIIAQAPGATIALYGGYGTAYGELKIAVRNGRRDPSVTGAGDGNNLVDGPALEWLASQPGPRIWISDGRVTGTHGITADCLADAHRIERAGDILRVERGIDAAAVLADVHGAMRKHR